MTTRLKLLITTIIIAGLVVASSYLGWQQSQSQSASAEASLKQRLSTHIQTSVATFFSHIRKVNQQLVSSNRVAQLFNEGSLEDFVEFTNLTTDSSLEVAVYDANTNTVFKKGKPAIAGEYYELENQILNQIKSPGRRVDVSSFRNGFAVINASGYAVDGKLTGIVFSILPLNGELLSQLNKQTGADFQLVINNQTIQSDPTAPYQSLTTVEWPFATKTKGELSFSMDSLPFNALKNQSQITYFIASAVLLLVLVVVVFIILNLQAKAIGKIKEASGLGQPGKVASALDGLSAGGDFDEIVSNFANLLSQQASNNRQLQQQVKQAQDRLNEIKSEKSAIQQERDHAVSAPKTKSEFLSRMGDEITTPMKTLTSMLHLLSEYNLDEEPKELLTIARRSSNTLINNLNNILDFSKLDARLLKLHKNEFDVRQLLEETVAEYKPHAEAKGLSLSFDVSQEVPEVIYNDQRRTKQILKNLIGNAIRFTKEGEVSLYADLVLENSTEFLRLTVKDSGVGIPEDAQKGLFDSLEQKTRLTNSSFAGRLRLIVSKKLSELMGGKIGVKSEINKGSRFWFTISLHK